MDFKGGERKVLPKRWNGETSGLVKHHGWRLISYDYVGAEQVLGAFNTYEKDLLREYHYRLLKCFESA